ncbi:Uu.00g082710.m01.CDS01 [Anthostomella pinea]|uniref:Uu.00g082710.m01.CDS01 n=1 Tax=Anthostomella pinea TaxID=933095 RepID=A0AAI8VLE8_9PEZI|nr:Uu.00g082710.m01.CDS01 [Anthostomella pinea]
MPSYSDDVNNLLGLIFAEPARRSYTRSKPAPNVAAEFSVDPEEVVCIPNPVGGTPSIFTTWGGLYDLTMKPEIAALGGLIFSLYSRLARHHERHIVGDTLHRRPASREFALDLHKRIMSSGAAVAWSDGTTTEYNHTASSAVTFNKNKAKPPPPNTPDRRSQLNQVPRDIPARPQLGLLHRGPRSATRRRKRRTAAPSTLRAATSPATRFTYPGLDVESRGGEFWWFGKLGNESQIVPGG